MTEFLPYVVSWNLTRKCNLRCKHCYIDASAAGPRELSTDEVCRGLVEIADVHRETILILTGGEPLLHADLDLIVSRAAALGMMVVLGTNGTTLTSERAARLADRGLSGVGISVDSSAAPRHDEFRGVPGAWSAAWRGVEAARRAGLEVQIQMTLTPATLGELSEVARMAREAGARVLTVFFLVCTGRGQSLVDLTPEQYESALRSLARAPLDGIMVRPRCAPTFRRVLAQDSPDSELLHSDAGRCMAGKNYCRITPEGDVTPCPYMPVTAESLRERSFGEIWRSSPILAALRQPALKGRCSICEYREICGGCRARAFASGGDMLGEDPGCAYVPGTDRRAAPFIPAPLSWTPEAEERIKNVPFFVRSAVRSAIESLARRRRLACVTPELLDEARRTMKRP
ncbi:MAG: radical SAM protein [Planctomycetes bacterium]|nr:radical SAM protein [Planctomycetota bacterium]